MRRFLTRTAAIGGTSLIAVALLAPVGASAETDQDYAGSAESAIVDLVLGDFTQIEGFELALAEGTLAPTHVVVDTQDGLEFAGETGRTAGARGTNLEGAIVEEIEGSLLVEAVQTAPPDNTEPVEEQLAEIPADPLLHTDLATADALAREPSLAACPDATTVAEANSTLQNTRLGTEQVDGNDFARLDQTVESHSDVAVVDGEAGTLAVQSTADADLQSIQLFGGAEADGADIDIVSSPTLTATATGTPGGASVDYSAPILQINGEGFDAAEEPQEVPIGDPELGFLARIQFGQIEQNVAEDGTSASASGTAIRITVLQSLAEGQEFTVAELAVAPMSVSATAPAGGITCEGVAADEDPFANLTKDASTQTVAPGDTFEYEITVPNDAECTVTDVTVTDVVTGPSGFTITGSEPEGTIDGNSVTWTFEELAPGDQETFVITVAVPDSAQDGDTFTDHVTVAGDCDGAPVTGEFLLPDIPRVDAPTAGGAAPDTAAPDSLPRTGGGLALLGLGAMAMAGRLRRRS